LCDVTVTLHSLAVKNHGIPPKYIDNILEVNKEYFKLPAEEKLKVSIIKLLPVFRIANRVFSYSSTTRVSPTSEDTYHYSIPISNLGTKATCTRGSKLAGRSLKQRPMMRSEQMMVTWRALMYGPSIPKSIEKPC
jgi:isopenicillin N synthase-like dioxygenase